MKSIEIFNFKNFGHLKIDDLGKVNLIVGRNNAGKSSLLEAISISASGADFEWMRNLLELRGISQNRNFPSEIQEVENFCTLYHDHDREAFKRVPIKILSEKDLSGGNYMAVEIKLVSLITKMDTDENGLEVRRREVLDPDEELSIMDGDINSGLMVTVNGSKSIFTLGRVVRRYSRVGRKLPFEYVRTAEFTGESNPDLFDKIALTPLEPILIEALHIIDPRIEAINFLKDDSVSRAARSEENRVPYVVLNGSLDKYRLSTMGDGINRMLTIILSMLNCRNGILLVDEFENGLHYSVQEGLWRLIFRLAEELNIQVFATTHSDDCIKSFLRATRNTGMSRLIRLERRQSGDVAVMYNDSEELDYISNNPIETR